jgi:hypothetical protein
VRHHHAVSHPAEQSLTKDDGPLTSLGAVHDDGLRGGRLELAHDQLWDVSAPGRIRTAGL